MLEERAQSTRDLIFIFGLGFLFRLALLLLFPVPYGKDGAGRLYFRDTIWFAHWLPVTEVVVYLSYAATHSIVIVRVIFALLGSFASVAFAFYLQTLFGRRTALIGGALFATNSLFVFLSLMPYQEIVFLGLLFGSLAFFVRYDAGRHPRRNLLVASVLYGLACLTRYEAWFILPALFLSGVWRAMVTRNWRTLMQRTAVSFISLCWGPVLWMFANWQKFGSATAFMFHHPDQVLYAWAPHAEATRVINYIGRMIYWMVRFGSPLVLLALPGIGLVWKERKKMLPILWPALFLLVLVLIFLTFIAERQFDTANRFASLPLGVTLVFVAIGANDAIERRQQSARGWLHKLNTSMPKAFVAGLAILFLLIYGAVPVVQANRLAEFREPYEVGRFLASRMSAGERTVIVAESFAGETPMFYQRLFGQLKFEKDRLLCTALLDPHGSANVETFIRERNVRYLVVFGDRWPRRGSDEIFLQLVANPDGKIRKVFAGKTAVVYELFL